MNAGPDRQSDQSAARMFGAGKPVGLGGGFVINALWYVLVAALLLWLIGFFVGGTVEGRRRWYYW